MARYIDADKFLESLISKFKCVPLVGTTSYMYGEECFEGEHIDTLINDQPTADVVEVKHSRWEYISGFDVCNICGTSPAYCEPKPNNKKGYPPYCHNCGAKMDGKNDNDLEG